MKSKLSLLSAAFAAATFAALPALAQNAPTAPVESGKAPVTTESGKPQASTESKTHASIDSKAKSANDKKVVKEKAAQPKTHEQIAQHPGDAKGKTDDTTGAAAAGTSK